MSIRIERIRINRGGPLLRDFELEPKDVNLIYGHNETGKSYIVEAMIGLLFRTGKRSTIDWALRNWEFAGSILVSGLEEKPIRFTRGGRKIDDYWAQDIGLPQDFSRLLVVKEGETALTDAREGANRDILKNYLSGRGILDELEKRANITSTLQEARIQYPRIAGSKRGEIKTWEDSLGKRQRLDELLKKAEESYTSGTIYDLRQKKEALETELRRLEDAKRYRAKCLQDRLEDLAKRKQELPTQEDLAKIESQISVYEDRKGQADKKSAALEKMQSLTENFEWAEQALQLYQDITSGKGITRPRFLWAILALIFIAGTAVTGFLGLPIAAAVCAVMAFGLSLYSFLVIRRALAFSGASAELDRLRAEFKSRFGLELTDQALLRTKVVELKEDAFRAQEAQRELEGTIWPELRRLELAIATDLKRFIGHELPPQDWQETVNELRRKLNEVDNEVNTQARELASLGVPEEEFLAQDPGIDWDARRYRELQERLNETSQTLNNEEESLGQLKARIAQETHSDSGDWEELISALRSRREQVAEEYRQVTAKILAKVSLYQVIQELRQQENAMIASGLESKELVTSLHAVTSRYKGMRYDDEEGLVLVTDEDEEYPLHDISTGAREQALLAMRLGFCSMLMKGKSAFLILDDAFQHSDWPRRSNLIDRVISIAESGWQIFYFTMDEHIRSLFLEVGGKLGDKFASCELG